MLCAYILDSILVNNKSLPVAGGILDMKSSNMEGWIRAIYYTVSKRIYHMFLRK